MISLLILICITLSIFQVVSVIEIVNSLRNYYHNDHQFENYSPKDNSLHIVIVIPVLREQRIIEETISYFQGFLSDKVKLVIITSEREEAERTGTGPTTREVLAKLHGKYIFHQYHYPQVIGTKADQINFFISNLCLLVEPEHHQETFITIYDADSRPSRATFADAVTLIHDTPNGNVFQQSATFFGNIENILASNSYIPGHFLSAMAVHQTRFTLCYELPRYRRRILRLFGSKQLIPFIFRAEYVHCVGHGLFIRATFLQKVPFPNSRTMEDIFYGVILSCLNEPIFPLRTLDLSEIPESISALISQKVRWFSGLAQLPSQLSYIYKRYGNSVTKQRLFLVGIYSLYDIFVWCCIGFWPLYLLFASLNFAFSQSFYSLQVFMTLLAPFCFYILSMCVVASTVNHCLKLSGSKQLAIPPFFNLGIGMITPVILIIHSISAWLSLVNILFDNKEILLSKTERV